METRLIHSRRRRLRQQNPGTSSSGFSMVELLIVIAIALVVMAIALPRMNTILTLAKWRGEMSDLSGVFQSCRSQAIRNNQSEEMSFATNKGLAVAYIFDLDADSSVLTVGQDTESMLAKQKQVWMFTQFSQVNAPTGTNPSPLTKASMWGGTDTSLPDTPAVGSTTDSLCFNSRGIPCHCPAAQHFCPAITNGYAFYFTQGTQWAAVGVSPAGRIKTYYWNGGAWSN